MSKTVQESLTRTCIRLSMRSRHIHRAGGSQSRQVPTIPPLKKRSSEALHAAGQLAATSVVPYNLATLLTLVNDLTAKYTLHNTDAASETPTYHQAQGTTRVLAATTAVTTLADAISRLNDIKAKFNLHDADKVAHTTGSKYQIAATDAALGAAIFVPMANVKAGDMVSWAILKAGSGTVTGVSAVASNGGVTFTFSADPQNDAIISYCVAAE